MYTNCCDVTDILIVIRRRHLALQYIRDDLSQPTAAAGDICKWCCRPDVSC